MDRREWFEESEKRSGAAWITDHWIEIGFAAVGVPGVIWALWLLSGTK